MQLRLIIHIRDFLLAQSVLQKIQELSPCHGIRQKKMDLIPFHRPDPCRIEKGPLTSPTLFSAAEIWAIYSWPQE